MPARGKILVIGGTGHFGRLLIDDLTQHTACEVVIGSRRPARSDRFRTIVADLNNAASLERALSGVAIAICAAGPFQALPTTLAELCLHSRIHYIDLADDRAFVRKVRSLVPSGVERLPAMCSGWSTVSALSGLLAEIGTDGLHEIEAIQIHMAPGNRIPRQSGTIASLLNSVGQPFDVLRDGQWYSVRGWSEPRSFSFPPPMGPQRGYLVDVPDHELFPILLRARTVEFRVGSELNVLNNALSLLAWLVERGMIRSWVPWNRIFQKAAAVFSFMGHDWGAIGVEVTGSDGTRRVTRRACVLAGLDGQRIAVMPASIMAAGLLSDDSKYCGLVSPTQWLTPEQLRSECEKRGFQLITEES